MDEDFVAYLDRRGISVPEYQGAPLNDKGQILSAYEQQRGKHFMFPDVISDVFPKESVKYCFFVY
jgi:hypothetical protein